MRASQFCGFAGPRPRAVPWGTARRSRGSRRPRRAVRPGRRPPRSGGVGDVLVAEDLGRPGVDVGGRQAGEVVGQGRGDVGGHVVGGRSPRSGRQPNSFISRVQTPGSPAYWRLEMVALRWSSMGQISTWAAIAGRAAVAGQQGDAGGQAAAGAGARDDDAGRVDAEFGGVLGDPEQAAGSSPRPGWCRWPPARAGSRRRRRRRRTRSSHSSGMSICEKRSPMTIPPPCIQ